MSTTKTHAGSIPASNHPFMTWWANYLLQINGFIAGPVAPDGFPYLEARAVSRWNAQVVPAGTALQTEWIPVSTKGTHTSAQTKQFETDKKKFLKNTLRPWNKSFVLYNPAFTVQHRATMGVLPVASSLRTASPLSTEQLFISWKSLGSCVYEFHCKTLIDAHRAACPEGKIVQYGYIMVNREVAPAVQAPAPLSVFDCPLQGISTHALFTHDFGAQNAGKIMYIFFRWFDAQHQEKSGPWGALVTISLA